MKLIIFLTWLLLFLALPFTLLITAGITYAGGMEKPKLIGKLFLAFIAHTFVTISISIFLLLLIVGAEPHYGQEFSTGKELICLLIVFGYGTSGWLLCSFINGKLIKSWTYFSLDSGKPQTIFGAK